MKQQGIRWVLSCGLILGTVMAVGCSDDGSQPATGSKGSSASVPGSQAPTTPTAPTPTPTPSVKPETPSTQPPSAMPEGSGEGDAAAAGEADVLSAEASIEGGRSVYNANCIACHSMDPTKDGALGPAVAGASPALLEARVLRGDYPEGYEPKRPTRVMIPLPHLEPRLPELAAYLSSLE